MGIFGWHMKLQVGFFEGLWYIVTYKLMFKCVFPAGMNIYYDKKEIMGLHIWAVEDLQLFVSQTYNSCTYFLHNK